MAHKATLNKKLGVRPFHIECSCNGTGGDFFDKESALQYMAIHAHRVKQSSGEIVEIVDKTAEPAKPEIAVPPPVVVKPVVAPVVPQKQPIVPTRAPFKPAVAPKPEVK